MKKSLLLLSITYFLSGCVISMESLPSLKLPKIWGVEKSEDALNVNKSSLEAWWKNFEDPVLDTLIGKTLSDSPDRKIAKARILEARGLRRSARSYLFPQIGASARVNREDFGFAGPGNFFDAGFDATYEVDVFGRVRNSVKAEDRRLLALEAEYHDITLTLIADVARGYIQYRAAQKQTLIAEKNLEIQLKTMALINTQYELGEAPRLDVERSENLVNTTRASIPEFKRMADTYRLQLSVLTGQLPEDLLPLLNAPLNIPGLSATPVLMAPAEVLAVRPDIRAAAENLEANTSLRQAAVASLFPTFSLEAFYGYAEGAFSPTENIWRIVLGTAVSLIDFGRIEGAIDAARAREIQAFELMRKTVLSAVTEVETALGNTSHINERRISLRKAYDNAERSFELSEILYKEGEISFLDVLDAQRTVNEADSALINAEAAQAESLVRLYKSLGVY